MNTRRQWSMVLPALGLAVLAGTAATASAQPGAGATVASTGNPQRDTLNRMLKPVTGEFKDQRVEDALKYIAELTGADIEPLWIDDQNPTGLDKDKQVSFRFAGMTALSLLERLMEKTAEEGTAGGNSWQLTESGSLQVGPKARLNKYKRVEIYDINDLLLVVPNYTNAPQFDLQSVLQNNSGGGGGNSPFRDNNQQQGTNLGPGGIIVKSRDERAKDLTDLITQLVDSEQWVDNGGEGGSIRFYPPGSLIVNAADYLHRQINGYPWWPQRLTTFGHSGGRRFVSFNGMTATNKLDGFANQPVTATVGGASPPPGGGG